MITFVGIDPGASGAIAFLNEKGELVAVHDMPVDMVKVGKSDKRVISPAKVVEILSDAPTGTLVMMERLVAMPAFNPLTGKRDKSLGAASIGSFFRGGGVIEGVCAALRLPLTLVMPNKWKTAVSCPTGKDGARQRAAQQFPNFATSFGRKKDDGRAEAALIGLYNMRQQAGV